MNARTSCNVRRPWIYCRIISNILRVFGIITSRNFRYLSRVDDAAVVAADVAADVAVAAASGSRTNCLIS